MLNKEKVSNEWCNIYKKKAFKQKKTDLIKEFCLFTR